MNLGYCYLRGHGVPADKEEALRLFREAVERGEDKAAQEVERLEGNRVYGRIPKGFKDRTSEGTGLALVGGVAPPEKREGSANPSKIRVVDETEPGKHFGLIGVSGVMPPKQSDSARSDEATEDELFPIFAEGGLKPDDLVEGVAERYAEYLNEHPTRKE
jgi:TPR repeat protein